MISQECKYNETDYRFPNILQRIRNIVKRTITRYSQWQDRRHNLGLLLGMEERMRKDIGLSRTDIDRLRNTCTFRVMFQPELNNMKTNSTRTTNYN